jgi:hypothetical protein
LGDDQSSESICSDGSLYLRRRSSRRIQTPADHLRGRWRMRAQGPDLGIDASVPRKRVLLQGDTPDEPIVHVYTGSTTWTKPADTFSHIIVEVQGGGGGGGGVAGTGANESSVSAGGGGGGYARKLIAAGSLTGSYTVTVEAGGSRGAAGNNNGSGGGASSFAGSGITTMQGNRGGGG